MCIQPPTWQLSIPTCIFHRHFKRATPQATPASTALPHLLFSPPSPPHSRFLSGRDSEIILIPPCPSALPIQPASEYISIMCPLSLSAVMSSTSTILPQLHDSSGLNGRPSPTPAPWICCWGCLSGFCPRGSPFLSLPSLCPPSSGPSDQRCWVPPLCQAPGAAGIQR